MSRVHLYPVTPALRDHIADLAEERGIKGYRSLSHRTGGEVSYQTVWRILTGQCGHARYATLAALADALGVPIDVLVHASVGASVETPWQLGAEFDKVPAEMRPGIERALLALFRAAGILSHADRI